MYSANSGRRHERRFDTNRPELYEVSIFYFSYLLVNESIRDGCVYFVPFSVQIRVCCSYYCSSVIDVQVVKGDLLVLKLVYFSL